jgi:hypothetical protein
MPRVLWAPVAALVLSCHAPSGAQFRATDDPAASAKEPAQVVSVESAILPASTLTPAALNSAPRTLRAPAPPSEPSDAGPVSLCCDLPSGLCYPDDGERCRAATSRMVKCPAVAVRKITDVFVVCAD